MGRLLSKEGSNAGKMWKEKERRERRGQPVTRWVGPVTVVMGALLGDMKDWVMDRLSWRKSIQVVYEDITPT